MYEKITSNSSLLDAYYRARRGNKQKPTQLLFEFNLENELICLREELLTGIYKPKPYKLFTVFEPKRREILAPAFRDRVVQQALVAEIEPYFDKTFIEDSYACRKNKGTHYGLKRAKKYLQAIASLNSGKNGEKFVYALQCDIKSYFSSISWDILLELIKKTINCKDTFELIKKFIVIQRVQDNQNNLSYPPNKIVSITKRHGIPIGNLTSQLFANIYLNQLDHFVKEQLRMRWYGRYMDDFYIIHPSKGKLRETKETIRQFLNDNLKLTLHPNKSVIKNLKDGLPFVGYRIFSDHVLVRGKTLIQMQRRLRKQKRKLNKGYLTDKELDATICSYKGHLKHANTYDLQKYLFKTQDAKKTPKN